MKETEKEKIIELLNLSHLEKKHQDRVVELFVDTVSSRIALELWKRLSEKTKKEIKDIGKFSEQKALEYLKNNVKNSSEIIENVLVKTVKDFLTRK